MSTIRVCIPSYNHTKYLPDLFESIKNQTCLQQGHRIQVFIMDDGSNDGSQEIIESFTRENIENVSSAYFVHTDNHGVWHNLSGLQKCNKYNILTHPSHLNCEGKYCTQEYIFPAPDFVQYCESDDYFYPTKFEKQLKFFEDHPDYAAVHTDVTEVFEDGRAEPGMWLRMRRFQPGGFDGMPQGNIRKHLLLCNFIMSCAIMVRYEDHIKYYDCEKFDKELGLGFGDYAFFLQLAKDKKIGYIDEDLSYYRVLPNSLSHAAASRPMMVEHTAKIQDLARRGIL